MTNAATAEEQVMVVPTELFHSCGLFQGFSHDVDNYLPRLLDPANTRYLPRGKMEDDPSFKQLIPYCVFRFTDETGSQSLFQYTRGTAQGESRLHSKRSIGVGGHISTLDLGDDSPYQVGMNRELQEEISFDRSWLGRCIGLINDDSNEVGQVHLGIVHLFEATTAEISPREDSMSDAGFRPLEELLLSLDQFETWSRILLESDLFSTSNIANRTA